MTSFEEFYFDNVCVALKETSLKIRSGPSLFKDNAIALMCLSYFSDYDFDRAKDYTWEVHTLILHLGRPIIGRLECSRIIGDTVAMVLHSCSLLIIGAD